ncbi:unnamed protein product [Schistosoma mattheei]|uniref:AAA+ ATPase domain-containing protein n=1 Tax=Schistosoma mattheei TaxID=31246 RepID=A0AA85B0U2_9TREM|nr:unnamed protein product [Schistosoma mattheei]
MAEIMALRTLLPLIWSAPVNLLYILLINCFLCHYLVWSVLKFSLVNIECEVLEIPTFSSLPTICCLLITMLGFGHWKKHLTSLTCFLGVPTLWLCSRYKPKKHLEVLWNSFMEACIAILLNIFPVLNYAVYYYFNDGSFLKFMIEILLLTPKDTLNKQISRMVLPLFTGIILLNMHTEFFDTLSNTLSYLPIFTVHFLVFLIIVSVTLLRYYHQTMKTELFLKFMSTILCVMIIGLYWNNLSNVFRISRQPFWKKRSINHLFWSGIVCLIFSVLTMFAYEFGNQEIFDIIFGVSLCILHYSEWCLYMTTYISESWLYNSCIITVVSVLLAAASTNRRRFMNNSVLNRSFPVKIFSWNVFAPCCLVPAILKLLLLWINEYVNNSTHHNTLNHRVHYNKDFVVGLYLLLLGLFCSERIYQLGKRVVRCLLDFYPFFSPSRIVIEPLMMVGYFCTAITLVWSQVMLLSNVDTDLFLTSNIYILIQFSISCLVTSLALILPSALNLNLISCETSGYSRNFAKLLDLNLSEAVVYVVTIPTCILCIIWMICLFSYATLESYSISVFMYALQNVIYPGLFILSVSFTSMISVNLFPPNLTVFLLFSIFVSCVVCFVIWDINDSFITDRIQCTFTNCESGMIMTMFEKDDSRGSLKKSSKKFSSVSLNNSRHSHVAVCDSFFELLIRLILLICSLVSLLILLVYLVHHLEVSVTDIICQLYTIFALKIFCIAQISVGYPQRWLCDKVRCRSARLIDNDSNYVLRFILISIVNVCIILSVILRYHFCPSLSTEIEIFFLPWIIFTFHGKQLHRYRHVLALTCFTILLLYMVFIHSPIVKGYAPSLPTFDRQFFGRTNSPLYYWSEFLLTIALCPLHLLFLADQSNITTQALADILFLNQFSQSHTHKQHSTTLLSSILCFKCLKFQIAYTLSYIFSCILYTAYGLLPFCISYWFVASSLASAIFGILMGFFSVHNHGHTIKSLFIQSFFPFFEIYNEIPLKPIESKHNSDSLHVLTSLKEFWSVIFTNPTSIWSQIRLWWYNCFPSTTSSVRYTNKLSADLQPKFKFNVDAVKIIQVIISLVGLGISIRLLFYLIEQVNPTMKEKRQCRKRAQEIFKAIGLKNVPKLNDYEVCVAVNLVDPQVLNTTWNSIGGLDSIIHEIKYGVLEPLRAKRLLSINSRLLQPPKGVLLYGPPGCGKTLLARAMAHAAHASFLNLQISTLVNMWYGETQKYVEATFSLAEKIQPTIIFIDELDSFLTTRSHLDNEATRMMKTQFMSLWDGLITNNNTQIVVVGATNRPGDLDQAILRRLSFKINVPLPNVNQRKHILKVLLKDDPVAKALDEDDFMQIASKTEGLSGSDLSELCRKAAFACLWSFLEGDDTRASLLVTVDHFTQALDKYMNDKIKLSPLDNTNFFPLD